MNIVFLDFFGYKPDEPDWKSPLLFQGWDVAMIKLQKAFIIDRKYVNPICFLPSRHFYDLIKKNLKSDTRGFKIPGRYRIVGWGQEGAAPNSDKLKHITVDHPMYEDKEEECFKFFNQSWKLKDPLPPNFFQNNSLCVTRCLSPWCANEAGQTPLDACIQLKGDPLIYTHVDAVSGFRGYLLGLASYQSYHFCDPGFGNGPFKPFKYISVFSLMQWILSFGHNEINRCHLFGSYETPPPTSTTPAPRSIETCAHWPDETPTDCTNYYVPKDTEYYKCECGQHNVTDPVQISRIYHGSTAPNNRYPWQVFINYFWVGGNIDGSFFTNHHSCGGVLISRRHVLTSAGCLIEFSKGR